MTLDGRSHPGGKRRLWSVTIAAIAVAVLGAASLVVTGYRSDNPALWPLPTWQVVTPWLIFFTGVLASIICGVAWALRGAGKRVMGPLLVALIVIAALMVAGAGLWASA